MNLVYKPVAIGGSVVGEGAPLVGIVVSDGIDVTRTDARGRFVLPGSGRFVTLTTPSGWTADVWYHPVDATVLDFELRAREQPSCRFAQVTDLHLSLGATDYGPDGDATIWLEDGSVRERVVTTPQILAGLFREIHHAEPGLDFVVATGDLTNAGVDAELAAYRDVVASSPVRVVSIPGNHDHHQALAAATDGEPLPYERFLGPRWFSFDHGGVHVVAIDWFTHRLGFDTDVQDAWLAADLALVPDGTPVVLLSHDQMPAAFFDRLPRRPVVTLSGHWHTDRVVDHGGTLHLNTGPATFGGLDCCPPHYRVVAVGADQVSVRTTLRGGRPGRSSNVARWTATLGEAAHMAGAEVVGDVVVGADGSGRVVGVDIESGAERWSIELGSAVKATPRAAGDAVIACTVAGEVVCVDASSGRARWRTSVHADPLHLWAYVRPLVHGGLVFAGDVGAFAALDLASGACRWCRSDLGHRENLTTLAHPVVVDGALVGTFAGQLPALFALDPATGAKRWPDGPVHGIYALPATEGADLGAALLQVVTGGITPDPGGADVYVVRLGSRVERVRAADGSVVWSSAFHGWFNPASPVVVGDAVVASTSTGQVWCYERATGERRWTTVVSTGGPLAMGSYRADGASVLAGVLAVGDRLLQPTGDGRIVVLDAAGGDVLGAVDAGAPLVAPLARSGDLVIAVGIDGRMRAFGIDLYE